MTPQQERSISAFTNVLAFNVILKAAMASPPQIPGSSSIALAAVEDPFMQPVTALARFSDRS
jgi:hypothetical protein